MLVSDQGHCVLGGIMTLRVWLWVTWLVGLMCFCFSILAIIDPTLVFDVISGLALIGLVVGFPVTLIMGFAIWRNFSRLWMMPSLLCLFFAFSPRIARPIGQSYNDRRFKASLHDYEAVVRQLKKRDVPSRAVFGRRNSGPISHVGGGPDSQRIFVQRMR